MAYSFDPKNVSSRCVWNPSVMQRTSPVRSNILTGIIYKSKLAKYNPLPLNTSNTRARAAPALCPEPIANSRVQIHVALERSHKPSRLITPIFTFAKNYQQPFSAAIPFCSSKRKCCQYDFFRQRDSPVARPLRRSKTGNSGNRRASSLRFCCASIWLAAKILITLTEKVVWQTLPFRTAKWNCCVKGWLYS